MRLSILIPTLPERNAMFSQLVWNITKQIGWSRSIDEIEVLSDNSEIKSIGEKRNLLLQNATGDYVCFIDDDDFVANNYVHLLTEGINKGVDCCSLKGVIRTNGVRPFIFEHSIKYKEYKTNEKIVWDLDMTGWNVAHEIRYERYPNHLNCIRADIAKQFKFPKVNWGEDTDWATQINASGLLKTEHYIDQIIYYYDYKTTK